MNLRLSDGQDKGMARRPGRRGAALLVPLEDCPGAMARVWQPKEGKGKTEWETRFCIKENFQEQRSPRPGAPSQADHSRSPFLRYPQASPSPGWLLPPQRSPGACSASAWGPTWPASLLLLRAHEGCTR